MKNSKLSETIRLKYLSGWSPRKGKTHSEATKRKISLVKKSQHIIPTTAFKKGQVAWNKGMKCIWTTERNKSVNPIRLEENAFHWLGDRIKYRGLHKWVYRKLGNPDTCQHCGKSGLSGKQINWCNISGKYLRDINDWIRLCKKCHFAFDQKNKRV